MTFTDTCLAVVRDLRAQAGELQRTAMTLSDADARRIVLLKWRQAWTHCDPSTRGQWLRDAEHLLTKALMTDRGFTESKSLAMRLLRQ